MIINNLIIYDNPIYQINAEKLVKYISDKDGWVANSTMISSDSLSSNYIGTLVSSIDRDTRIISMSPSSTMMLYNLPEDPNYNKYQIMKSGTINNKQLEFVEVNGHDDNIGEKLFDQLLQYYNLSVSKSNTHPEDDSDPLLNNLDIRTATNYYELYEYYVNHLQGKSMIAYDLETNSSDIYNSTDSRVIGFSLSEVGSKSGIYVLFESSDYKMPDEDKRLCEELLKYILSDNNVTLVIQNIAFEIPQTRTWLGIELPYERVEDTMVQSRMRVFRGVGLKNQVMLNLGYKDWSEDLDKVLSSVGMLLNSSHNDGLRYIIKCLTAIKDNDLSQFSSTNDFINKVMNDNTDIDFHTKLSKVTKKCQGLWSVIVTLDSILSKYQDVDSTIKTTYWEYLIKNINELEVTGQVRRGAYFYDLPSKLISRYGALDAILTGELYEFNKIVLKSDSNKYGIDLFDGYKLFLRHQYLAMIFGSNGMYWDEDRVLYYEKLVMDQGLKHLIEMLKFRTPYIMSELKYSLRGRMIDYDMNRDYGLLHHIQLHPNFVKIDQDGKITMLVARKTGKSAGKLVNKSYPRDKYLNLYDFMSKEYMDELFNSYIDIYLNDIITRDDYDMFNLLEDININSPIIGKTIIQEFINNNMEDYVTGEVFEVLPPQVEALSGILGIDHPIVQSIKMYAENKYKLGLYDWYLDNMNSLKLVQDGKFKLGLNLVNQINNSILANSYRTREEHYMLDKSKFDASILDLVTKKTDSSIDVYYGTPEWWIKQWSDRADINSDLTLGADEESMISLYKKITCCSNIDVDKPETWTDAYRFLYHYRSFKKCFKIKSTYIDGDALGRNTVSLASKSKTQNGEVPIRTKHYVPKDQLGPDDIYISMIPFRPFSAATGRWTSGMHTVPWKSPAREFYGSRFYGGIVIAPDYSQAEVRVLASSSQEENLLKAYADGIDVHGMTAEGIFGKDYTEAQRRYAKMGCLTKDTKIYLLDNTTDTIENLFNRFKNGEELEVVSFSEGTGVTSGKVTDVQLTKYVNHTVKVTFDTGNSIECTPDHPLLVRGREDKYINAEHSLDHDIETFYYRSMDKGAYYGYLQWRDTYVKKKNKLGVECGYTGKWEMAHRIVVRENNLYESEDGVQLHHVNHNRQDNRSSNLKYLSLRDHGLQDHTLIRYSKVINNLKRMGKEVNEFNYDNHRPSNVIKWSSIINKYGEDFEVLPDFEIFDNYPTRVGGSYGPTNVKVVKVEHIYYDEPIPVYDLSVDKYHNYAVNLDKGTGVFVHNTFRILYGGSAEGFAKQNLSGNVELANRIYEGFYSTYPKVKDWVAMKHQEMLTKGVVTLITNRYIPIPKQPRGQEKKMYNQAQNFPIQGASSDITADTMFQMYLYLRDNNLKSKPFCFVHDSLELDIHPDEIFKFIPVADHLMNNYGREKFNVPLKADMVFGKSMGEEIELINIDKDTRTIECEGWQNDIDRILVEWKSIFKYVKCYIYSRKDKYQSYDELWVAKKAFDANIGSHRTMTHMKIELGEYVGLNNGASGVIEEILVTDDNK